LSHAYLPQEIRKIQIHESNLKVVEGSKNISCNYAWFSLIACTKSMTKTSHACASLIKFLWCLKDESNVQESFNIN
jgi:hypothetical protein